MLRHPLPICVGFVLILWQKFLLIYDCVMTTLWSHSILIVVTIVFPWCDYIVALAAPHESKVLCCNQVVPSVCQTELLLKCIAPPTLSASSITLLWCTIFATHLRHIQDTQNFMLSRDTEAEHFVGDPMLRFLDVTYLWHHAFKSHQSHIIATNKK